MSERDRDWEMANQPNKQGIRQINGRKTNIRHRKKTKTKRQNIQQEHSSGFCCGGVNVVHQGEK